MNLKRRIRDLANRAGEAIRKYVPDFVADRAKAIAGFVAPYIVAVATDLGAKVGLPINLDLGYVQLLVIALLTGGVVHEARNRNTVKLERGGVAVNPLRDRKIRR